MKLRRALLKLPRDRRIALAVPGAASWLARADTCRNDDVRAYLTERLFRHLAAFGLDFRADVFEAIDRHNAEVREQARRAAGKHPHDAAAIMWGIPAGAPRRHRPPLRSIGA